MVWAAVGFVGTFMPLPDELQFLSNLPNSFRWLALLAVIIGLVFIRYPRHMSWSGFKNLMGIGISWEGRGWNILGMTGKGNPDSVEITGFQLRGYNNSRKVRRNAKAYLVFPDGREIPLIVTTSDGSMDHAEQVNVAPKTRIYTNGQFEKLDPEEFIENFSPIRFIFTFDGGVSEKVFSRRLIKRLINRFKCDNTPKPDTF